MSDDYIMAGEKPRASCVWHRIVPKV